MLRQFAFFLLVSASCFAEQGDSAPHYHEVSLGSCLVYQGPFHQNLVWKQETFDVEGKPTCYGYDVAVQRKENLVLFYEGKEIKSWEKITPEKTVMLKTCANRHIDHLKAQFSALFDANQLNRCPEGK